MTKSAQNLLELAVHGITIVFDKVNRLSMIIPNCASAHKLERFIKNRPSQVLTVSIARCSFMSFGLRSISREYMLENHSVTTKSFPVALKNLDATHDDFT
jgi:hypothetical protein